MVAMLLGLVTVSMVSAQCSPSPCGINTQCTVLDGGAVCECMSDYQGDPLSECKPECILSSDCPSHLACIRYGH